MMNSVFWQYFSKVLNWPLLKSRYLQALVKGLAAYMDAIRGDIIYVRNQYFVELSEPELLEDYAASRGIKRLKLDTDETFRKRVLNAYRWQKYAGKETGLPVILAEYGYPGASVGYPDAPEKWAEFTVTFSGYRQDAAIVPLINEYKPARSRLTLLVTPASTSGIYTVLGFTRTSDTVTSVKQAPTAGFAVVGITALKDYINSFIGD